MSVLRRSRHLLFLTKEYADDLIDRRLDKAAGNRIAVAIPVRVVDDKLSVTVFSDEPPGDSYTGVSCSLTVARADPFL